MRKPIMIDNNRMECIDIQKIFARDERIPYAAYTNDGYAIVNLPRGNGSNSAKPAGLILTDLYMLFVHSFDFVEPFKRFCISFQKMISIYIALSSIDENDGPQVLAYSFVRQLKGTVKKKYINLF